jgi:hypothetical protein
MRVSRCRLQIGHRDQRTCRLNDLFETYDPFDLDDPVVDGPLVAELGQPAEREAVLAAELESTVIEERSVEMYSGERWRVQRIHGDQVAIVLRKVVVDYVAVFFHALQHLYHGISRSLLGVIARFRKGVRLQIVGNVAGDSIEDFFDFSYRHNVIV